MRASQYPYDAVTDFVNNKQFSDLFNLEEIQRLQDLFAEANGVASLIMLPDGTPITRASKFTRFCNDFIHGAACPNYFIPSKEIGRPNTGSEIVQLCTECGLWNAASALTVGGKHFATWIIGQVRNNEEVDQQRLIRYANEIGANSEELLKAFNEVPIISVEQFKKMSNLMVELAGELSEKALNNLQLKIQIAEQKKTIELLQAKEAGETLRESEKKYRILFDNNPQAMWIYDLETLFFLEVNDAALKHYGYSREEFMQMTLKDIHPDEDLSALMNLNIRTLPSYNTSGEWRHIWKNGEIRFVEITSHSVFFNGRNARHVLIHDITERKLTEEKLRESEERFRELYNNAKIGLYRTTLDGTIVMANKALLKMLGYPSFETLALRNLETDDFGQSIQRNEFLEKFETQDEIINLESTWGQKDGSKIFVTESAQVIRNPDGSILFIDGVVEDITERKQAVESLQESEERFRHSFDYAASGTCIVDIIGKFQKINNAFKEILGYEEEELKNFTFSDITYPDDLPIGLNQLKRMLAGEIENASFEKRYIRKDNRIIWAYISTSLIRDINYKPLFFITQTIDISERKQAEKDLAMLAHALKSINECVYITDLEDKILFVNEPFLKTYGYALHELIGKKTDMLGSQNNDQDLVKEILPAALRDEWKGELFSTRKDGSEFPVFLSTSNIKDKENKATGLIGVVTDITERKRFEDSLLKLSRAVEQTVDTIVITNRHGKIEYVNHTFEAITGYTAEEVVGKTPGILKSGLYDKEFYSEMWQTILSGRVFRAEMHNKKKNGELHYVEITISPIFDPNKNITHFLGTGVDITERKLAEQELIKAKEKAEESDRLKSAFLANMSHEVRTPLNSIIGFSELLADPGFEDEQKTEFIQHIIQSGNNLLSIINDIMDISKLESGELKIHKTQINAQQFISRILEQFSFQAESINLQLRIISPDKDKKAIIFADPNRLSQIFNNLISNAFKFTPTGYIEIGYQSRDHMVEFYVKDTGIGIPAEYHDKIFERFRQVETEKSRKYGGNGLGLAITRNLVELMGGKIWLHSESGQGSSFHFCLPTLKHD